MRQRVIKVLAALLLIISGVVATSAVATALSADETSVTVNIGNTVDSDSLLAQRVSLSQFRNFRIDFA